MRKPVKYVVQKRANPSEISHRILAENILQSQSFRQIPGLPIGFKLIFICLIFVSRGTSVFHNRSSLVTILQVPFQISD